MKDYMQNKPGFVISDGDTDADMRAALRREQSTALKYFIDICGGDILTNSVEVASQLQVGEFTNGVDHYDGICTSSIDYCTNQDDAVKCNRTAIAEQVN